MYNSVLQGLNYGIPNCSKGNLKMFGHLLIALGWQRCVSKSSLNVPFYTWFSLLYFLIIFVDSSIFKKVYSSNLLIHLLGIHF